jgi:hypothetical protein
MADAFVIETSLGTAGVVARDTIGFRFYASQPPFFALEGRRFATPAAARRSAEKLAATYATPQPMGFPWRRLRRHGAAA